MSACKILERLIRNVLRLTKALARSGDLAPMHREACQALLDQIAENLVNASTKMDHSSDRIEEGLQPKVRERILSVADQSAVLIVKGQRDPVLGYKPQLARSKDGE